MKRQADNRGFPRGDRRRFHDKTVSANQMDAILFANARVHLSSHLDAPRSVSSQYFMDDADIAATVRDAIDCITKVSDGALQVDARNGWVTLRGTLGDWARRECVERIVLHSFGVRGVLNSITVDERLIPII